MEIKARYQAELTARDGVEQRAAAAVTALSGDARLADNAKKRNGNVRMQKWWSVVSGILLVVTFILYSFYLTIPALISLGVLVAFLVYVGISLRMQRKVKENAEHEISPRRSLDALVRRALGMEVSGRDATVYMPKGDIAIFGARLRAAVSEVAAAEGVKCGDIAVSTAVKVTEAGTESDTVSFIPAEITLTLNGCIDIVLTGSIPFAIAPTGDCIPADASPMVGEAVKTEIPKKKK